MGRKYLILVGDGMGDYPLPELKGMTPLEAARTPAMDYLARHGELAALRTIPYGYPPGSDVANLSLMGYLPEECYTGRAPLEAASMGVELAGVNSDAPDVSPDVAFRCNLVTLDFQPDNDIIMLDYSAGHISSSEAKELIQTIDVALSDEKVKFHPGVSYRHLMVHRGHIKGLITVPPHDYTGRSVKEFWNHYMVVPHVKILLDQACRILASHEINGARIRKGLNPANAIWLWGEGTAPTMRTLTEQYGITGALISAVDLLKGIGVYAGMEIINVPGATGYLDTNYEGKVKAALNALRENDMVLVHVEAPDEASHQGLLREKIQAIEDFDQKIVQPMLNGLRNGPPFRMVVAMDHFTPIIRKTHMSDPVPIIMFDSERTELQNGSLFQEKNLGEAVTRFENGREFFSRFIRGK